MARDPAADRQALAKVINLGLRRMGSQGRSDA